MQNPLPFQTFSHVRLGISVLNWHLRSAFTAPWHPDFSAFIPACPLSSSCTGTLPSIPSWLLSSLSVACPLPDELGDEGGLWTHLSCQRSWPCGHTPHWTSIRQHSSALCRGLPLDPALKSPSPPHRRVPSYRSSLCPPPHPSITLVGPSSRSWYRVASLEESCRGTWAKAPASPSPSGCQAWRPCHCW